MGAVGGGLTFWLVEEFDEVHAFDCSLDGLQFIRLRSEQEGISNVKTAQGNIFSLPYPNDFFDVVVLNGVLEWVGTFSDEHPPEQLQETALREIVRVLRPQGTLLPGYREPIRAAIFLRVQGRAHRAPIHFAIAPVARQRLPPDPTGQGLPDSNSFPSRT